MPLNSLELRTSLQPCPNRSKRELGRKSSDFRKVIHLARFPRGSGKGNSCPSDANSANDTKRA